MTIPESPHSDPAKLPPTSQTPQTPKKLSKKCQSSAPIDTSCSTCVACRESPSFLLHGVSICSRPEGQRRETSYSAPIRASPRTLDAQALACHNNNFNKLAASYETEVCLRSQQEAGVQLGFNLKLDCYEGENRDISTWVERTNIFSGDRVVLKDEHDIVDIYNIKRSFSPALVAAVTGLYND